jgi:predicted 2-oxoglutarate/Fe(II)-dependent dioxygenase YbiX
LNDSYEGALLDFPRQQFTNAQLPVGSLLAWPSLVTHPHGSTPIISGVKYSLTIWFELPISLS